MSSPWSSSAASASGSRLIVERAHEEFVRGNAADPRIAGIRPVVRDSWRRSLDLLVGVEGLPPLALSDDELAAHRDAHPLSSVMEMIRALLIPGDAEDAGVAIAVGDASGRLLWVEGDRRIRSLTGEMGFVPGADWSEHAVGTAAPGTALALGRSVQIRGAEHFNRLVQPWSCTAAPVHDPETREVLGLIDVTGGEAVVTAQAQLLVDATARAIEGEILLARMRASEAPARRRRSRTETASGATLRVLGRDRGLLEITTDGRQRTVLLSERHAEIMLMLAVHRQGLSTGRIAELIYGDAERAVTVRAEMVRLRKILERSAPFLVPESRPYRLPIALETDAHRMLSLLDRGAHRVALAACKGEVLPDSVAPGVEEFRTTVHDALRESLMTEAGIDVLTAFADTDAGRDDVDLLRLCLGMLPPRSPKRAGLVARLEHLTA